MIVKLFFLTLFILIVSSASVFAKSLDALPDSERITRSSKITDPPCLNLQYEYKKIHTKAEKDLLFPPGTIVEVTKCMDENVQEDKTSKEQMKQAEIDQEKAIRKLSFLLSLIYHQQNDLAGSYKKTDRSYDDLKQKKAPVPKVYDRAVANYETALKNYGEYQAFLSVLPRAVSDYEEKVGASFKDFALQNEDGMITMMKTPVPAQLYNPLTRLDLEIDKPESTIESLDEYAAEKSGKVKDKKEARKDLCMLMGAFGGGAVIENIFLATLSNPLSAVLGVSLGATLCAENIYEKMTLWPKSFKAKVVGMGAYIKEGLDEIGSGLYNIGRKYLYVSPSKAGEKITEHFKNAKSWLNRKLGWE
jgi:hypothetical protein